MPKAAAIIPARFESTRFPGKPLAALKGKTVIQHVFERASDAKLIDIVIVATDDKRIFNAVNSFGGKAVMTSASHACGTDRIAEAAGKIECDFVINVQGDEPFIKPEMIDEVVELLYNDDNLPISTLAKRTTDINDIFSPNVVKVVMNSEGYAMYFSRAPLPFYRDEWQMQNIEYRAQSTDNPPNPPLAKGGEGGFAFQLSTFNFQRPTFFCYKHIGIYGFRKDALMKFTSMRPGRLEQIEKLEQLRALEAGMRIKVKETRYETFGIDTVEDLRKAEELQNENCKMQNKELKNDGKE
ncbi:MAG: 3-deoxy-manno-octulosonate cytidylyltransferase [Nitrospirae bacterium]|nr:3-deoxy-manno-octulosonate cytidylyltransferase [Nitrospirota bacterium]